MSPFQVANGGFWPCIHFMILYSVKLLVCGLFENVHAFGLGYGPSATKFVGPPLGVCIPTLGPQANKGSSAQCLR